MTHQEPQKKKGLFRFLDKIFMGIIVGGAIGSVIGMTVAPKKGKETRQILKEKGKELTEKGIEAYDRGKQIIHERTTETERRGRGFFGLFRRKVKHLKEDWKVPQEELRQIPHEHDDAYFERSE